MTCARCSKAKKFLTSGSTTGFKARSLSSASKPKTCASTSSTSCSAAFSGDLKATATFCSTSQSCAATTGGRRTRSTMSNSRSSWSSKSIWATPCSFLKSTRMFYLFVRKAPTSSWSTTSGPRRWSESLS